MAKKARRYVSWVPLGIGHQRPNAYAEIARTMWRNRDQLGYAWRILNNGCCDGCSLGTAGIKDWTISGVHLCSVRLNMLRMNTAPAAAPALLEQPAGLRGRSSRELRELGRLAYPMIWRRGEAGYRRVSWDEALRVCGKAVRRTAERDPDRLYFYLTSRGMYNEAYYTFNKAARFLGTNNIDNAARICHAPSTVALTAAIGYGACTCSYKDWIGTDLLVLVGTNLPNNQPVSMKYIDEAKKKGTRVVVVNPYREEGLDKYWVPSNWDSALFGTRIMDDFYQVAVGGDAAFFTGALKHLLETGRVDRAFVEQHTSGFAELEPYVSGLDWTELERDAGLPAAEIRRFAELYAGVQTSVTVWSMGVTQHEYGVQNVASLINLALALGRVGKPHCGLVPIRGHSGVQAGGELGAVPNACGMGRKVSDPAARAEMEQIWGFPVPERPGLSATAAIHACHDGQIDLLYAAGGNFLETLPEPDYVREALERVPVRIFQDIVINPMMLLEPGEVSVILPAATRYETPGGVTQVNTERRIIFSPEVPGRRIGEARPEWQIPLQVAGAAFPERREQISFVDTAAVRAEIARVVPEYDGIQGLRRKGDQVQWGGPHLGAGGKFHTADGRAWFQVPRWQRAPVPAGMFYVTTRRGKQFNSMIWDEVDPLTGAAREEIIMARADAERLGLRSGDPILLRSEAGELRGKVRIGEIRPGNLAVHWPEGNCLIRIGRYDPLSGEPDYNAMCQVVALGGAAEEMSP